MRGKESTRRRWRRWGRPGGRGTTGCRAGRRSWRSGRSARSCGRSVWRRRPRWRGWMGRRWCPSNSDRRAGSAAAAVLVTMRMLSGVGFLRGFKFRRAIEDALRAAKERFGMRVVHYSIQGNHLHLILEADEPAKFSRAVQGLAVRIARALNRVARRTGRVFSDRFHAHVLKALREVKYAVGYVVENFRHHLREDVAPQGLDPCSSAGWKDDRSGTGPPFSLPRTWLLRHAA